jgi:hypothetical protein
MWTSLKITQTIFKCASKYEKEKLTWNPLIQPYEGTYTKPIAAL